MKRPFSVGYFSSYDRGLSTLLDLWPQIKEQVPEVTLDIYYGWNIYDKAFAGNPDGMRWKWQMIRKIHDLEGVSEHGRVDHITLAQKMKEIQVWAYPTEFTEIHCITALKAQEAGCLPVTTGVAALKETVVNHQYTVEGDDIYQNEELQKKFVDSLVKALKDVNEKEIPIEKVPNRYWSEVATVWDGAMV